MGLWVVPVTALAAPGDHIRVGALEIIPSVGAGAEYRTNVYRRETNGVAASNVLVSPALTAKAAGEDHAFQAGVDWELRKFFFVGDADRGAAGNFDGRVQNLDRFNEFSANVGLDNFKRNAVGLRLNNRTALQNWTIDRPVSDLPYSSQFRNAASLGVRVNPGPALEFVPGARWTFDDFQSFRPADGVERFSNIRNSYGPTLDAGWAFLPRTSLVLRGSYLVHNWQRNELESDDQLDGGVLLPDSRHLKVWTGLDGRLTEKLFLQLLAGYGSAAYSIDGLTGVAGQEAQVGAGVTGPRRLLFKTQVRYDLTPSTERRTGTKFSVGYLRDFRDSAFTNFVTFDQMFVEYDGRFGPVAPLVKYEVRLENYTGELARRDVVNRVNADLAYWFRDYASASAGMWWMQRASEDDVVEYDDFNLHLSMTFQY